jgi:putative tricarboxylic transport membrane protein
MATFFAALDTFLKVHTVLACAIGSVIGFIIGAIPGLGPTVGVALAIPFSLRFDHTIALTLFMGIYSGAEFGGCISSILINVPGTGAAAATTLDGFPMAKQGRAITAISISTTSSAFGGCLAPLILILLLPVMSKIILIFGTPEFFLLSLLGITCIAAVSKGSMLPGLITGAFGLMLCTVGIAPTGMDMRYTFGSVLLFDGFDFLPAIIGVFGVAEMLKLVKSTDSGISQSVALSGSRLKASG